MTFSEKLERLSLRKGKSPRAVALFLGMDASAPAQWKKRGSVPSPDKAKLLADYFGMPVEDLLDDARELPRSDQDYLNESPIKTAGAMATSGPGAPSDRQKAFEEYLEFLQSIRAQAEAAANGDPHEARRLYDRALATWLAEREAHARGKKNLEEIMARGRDAKRERRQA